MSSIAGFELLAVLDAAFRKNYEGNDLINTGNSSKVYISLTYKDGEMEINVRVHKKRALQMYFDQQKKAGKYKNIDFESFEEKFEEGIGLDEIEKEIKKEQLPFEDGDKK